ncbi:MAG: hypothetical protein ACREXR_02180 [Gammaproteobacteria bacterium]
MKKCIALLTLAGVLSSGLVQAAPKSVQGLLSNVIVQPAATATLPAVFLALKPVATDCWLGLMNVPNAESAYGKAVLAAALSAQAGGKTVSVTYDPADACKISQFVVVTP